MIWAILGSVTTLVASAAPLSAPTKEESGRVTYEGVFIPLARSERSFSALGPAGPYYPEKAIHQRDGGVSVTTGQAVLECKIKAEGVLDRCRIISETPSGLSFGTAAKVLADHHRIIVKDAPPDSDTVRVHVPFTPIVPATVGP